MTEETAPEETAPAAATPEGAPYRVLARKYRPTTFADLVGQDALVRTLTNAINSGRLAHAFILTGVRGVGKTTTARIIARALNCTGPDGTGGPTPQPCGVCDSCRSILAERNVDVMEMDAASRTGIGDIREIIDSVRYGPVSTRYKIYIIDEVHMLSTAAFNGLLKTLEEPPPHTKFIFATTEIRKVPVTVLSRCQRFDLRRLDGEELSGLFSAIAGKEGIEVEPEAISLIARAADGSARDGLSLMDQAIALGAGQVEGEAVRRMLGLADRTRIFDLYESLMAGRAREALDQLADFHRAGADPLVVLQDLLEVTHFLTRVRLLPEIAESPSIPEAERTRGAALAGSLPMPVLTRAWQMLLKGVGEVQTAPSPAMALEMVLIRLMHAASLPTPGDVLRRIEKGDFGAPDGGEAAPPQPRPNGGAADAPPPPGAPIARAAGDGLQIVAQAAAPAPIAEAPPAPSNQPRSFRELVALLEDDVVLHGQLYSMVHPVRLEPGRLEFRPEEGTPPNLASRLTTLLKDRTGIRWMVSVSGEPGAPTLSEQDRRTQAREIEDAKLHPTVKAIMDAFPGAKVEAVHDLTKLAEAEMTPPPGDPDDAIGPDDVPDPDPDDFGEFDR
ncbi:DNA polymerase III subunit gamma/tau [Inquilinus sp. CAU 1745]|uniref:DNA polymerase III subunit gamma/tau n=1 Tax=Inquilinus sp. CAU 1745 TaxID=3140369 RepID=UPI00325AC13C